MSTTSSPADTLQSRARGRPPVAFSLARFVEPEPLYWPGYFWLWNGPLDPEVLRTQLRDMRAHDARSVCVLPMPREFRPDSAHNQMDVSYLGPEFFQRVQVALGEAARLGMHYWLYDEGGWPSGTACGQVTQGHPELKPSILPLGSDAPVPTPVDGVDRLNPEATRRFIQLTHDGYSRAVSPQFGGTIRFVFTDEPAAGTVVPGKSLPWTRGLGDLFEQRFGYRIEAHLTAFSRSPGEWTREERRRRVDFFECWTQQFVDAYFLPIRQWCRAHGLLSAGHLGGEDETMGAVTYGYGHVLRGLRALDVPGVDAIWRQVFPGQSNHHFPLFAATAAHQIGSPHAFTESFAVYGNGLTPEQMKWITDYQYVRGMNLLVGACYPLSTRDHHMAGERPHFGPVNPLWDYMPAFHAYAARVGYALSSGRPNVETALYYPVRDMWAQGVREATVEAYEALVDALLRNPCGFDLIDDDALVDEGTTVRDGLLGVGPMRYRRVLFPPCAWLGGPAAARVAAFVRAGGEVLCLGSLPGVNGEAAPPGFFAEGSDAGARVFPSIGDLIRAVPPLVRLETADPLSARAMRVISRKLETGTVYFLFNEGDVPFDGSVRFPDAGSPGELDSATGKLWALQAVSEAAAGTAVPMRIPPGGSRLLLFGGYPAERRPDWRSVGTVPLVRDWQARAIRQFDAGEHDYEVQAIQDSWAPVQLGSWAGRFSGDFSGDVAYRITVAIPEAWRACAWKLDLGRVEYAATVRVNGQEVGKVTGPPYEILLPAQPGSETLEVEVVVTNTLANALTSARVRSDWSRRQGPGWPGPYDARAAVFERESRGGGLFGPVCLEAGCLGRAEGEL